MIDGSPQHDDAAYVSTGQLPSPEQVRRSVDEAYQRYRAAAGGERSRVYPALARVPADLLGIMSVAKPFVFALVCQALGHEAARERLGANATGLPFNSLAAVERGPDGRTNPMVNAGAIATTSLTLGVTPGCTRPPATGCMTSGCRAERHRRPGCWRAGWA